MQPPPVFTNPVVVIGSQFLATHPVELIIKTKLSSRSEGDFSITDVNETVMFSIKGKFRSRHHRRTLLDAAGNPLITLRKKTAMIARNRWKVFRGSSSDDKDLLFTVMNSKMLQFKTGLSVFMAGNTEEDVADFTVRGSLFKSSVTIYLGESKTIIARMREIHSASTIFLNRDSSAVTVYPNVDYAFIVALVVILKEIKKEINDQSHQLLQQQATVGF